MVVKDVSLQLSCGEVVGLLGANGAGKTTTFSMVVGLLRAAPAAARGRVMGIRSLGIYGLPLGLLLGGWISEYIGSVAMIGTFGTLGLIATLFAAIKWPALFRKAKSQTKDSPNQ